MLTKDMYILESRWRHHYSQLFEETRRKEDGEPYQEYDETVWEKEVEAAVKKASMKSSRKK